jgi:uncharacterized protein with ParB-like and HNH nuclease domain
LKANTLTPAGLFGLDTRYVVPLFQRPYVWNERNQWDPLWQDVRLVAEQVLTAAASPRLLRAVAPHFLGAIVLEQVPTSGGASASHRIIDGQQRLMTLQLLLDAAEEVTRTAGDATDANDLRRLVRNQTTNPDAPRSSTRSGRACATSRCSDPQWTARSWSRPRSANGYRWPARSSWTR